MNQLEIKRAELAILVDNFCLSSEIVVKKAREFEELLNILYVVKDGAYWMKRAQEMEKLLVQVAAFCPAGYKYEIEKVLRVKE